MTNNQFAAIAKLIRLRGVPSNEAARAVVIEGIRHVDAALKYEVSRQSVTNAVRRVNAALELCKVAAA